MYDDTPQSYVRIDAERLKVTCLEVIERVAKARVRDEHQYIESIINQNRASNQGFFRRLFGLRLPVTYEAVLAEEEGRLASGSLADFYCPLFVIRHHRFSDQLEAAERLTRAAKKSGDGWVTVCTYDLEQIR